MMAIMFWPAGAPWTMMDINRWFIAPATIIPEAVMAAGVGHETYFDSAAIIIGLILFGRWLEARAKGQAAGAVKTLMKLRPDTARVLREGRRA